MTSSLVERLRSAADLGPSYFTGELASAHHAALLQDAADRIEAQERQPEPQELLRELYEALGHEWVAQAITPKSLWERCLREVRALRSGYDNGSDPGKLETQRLDRTSSSSSRPEKARE